MVVDNMTRGSCIPIDYVKSGDDYSSLVYNIRIRAYIDSDKTNPSQKRSGWNMNHYMHRNNCDYNLYHQDVKNKQINKQTKKEKI